MSKNTSKPVSTKSNNLIDAGFFKKLNGMEIRIVNLAISKLNPTRSLSQNRRFEFSVQDFLDCNSGISDHKNAYDNVKNAVLRLSNIWVQVEPLSGYDYSEISLLTDRSYTKGKGRFMIEFHEKAMPYLAEIRNNYTSILLETFGALKSEYSLKMYEILSRWAFKGFVSIKLDELKILLDVVGMYDRYNNFSQRVLTPAVKEINAKTNLIVSVKPIRTGRAISELEFKIFDKSKAIPEEEPKRPRFPHKNRYGRFVKLDRENPKMSSADYGLWARDCLKILEDFYQKIEDVPNDDLLFYWIFLAINASNKSKLGTKKIFADELKKRGYKIVECELVKI
ncbi:replication initiation protein [Actinobacillus pleuropneumoniae]|uniref:replication initiation protein n=1 Tax=Actinobacillus pleuropneumoniae TaxID=715 RepID=UPI002021E33E|nr:replication initiation protein [Actinobacillus pleuropneumoniae]MCL7725793.1 replication initiation protein [Actinobacillus pleuropneumoniae]MCL7737838.1 replication initiation protein [Actinobacillus pleuropneumoniae]